MSGRNLSFERSRVILSTLWIFAILNYLYADVMGSMDAEVIETILSGSVGSMEMTPGFFFMGAILMETAIVMVLLARVLAWRANRIANIIAGVINTLAVFASMFVKGPPALYYIFFATIEIACTLFIIWFALTWKKPTEDTTAL
jgi:hypothetical protein